MSGNFLASNENSTNIENLMLIYVSHIKKFKVSWIFFWCWKHLDIEIFISSMYELTYMYIRVQTCCIKNKTNLCYAFPTWLGTFIRLWDPPTWPTLFITSNSCDFYIHLPLHQFQTIQCARVNTHFNSMLAASMSTFMCVLTILSKYRPQFSIDIIIERVKNKFHQFDCITKWTPACNNGENPVGVENLGLEWTT